MMNALIAVLFFLSSLAGADYAQKQGTNESSASNLSAESKSGAPSVLDPFQRQWSDEGWKHYASRLAIQSGGRVKPFDTFAREGLEVLTGRQSFRGKDSIEIMFSLSFEPQVWQKVEFLRIGHRPLKKDLGLDEKRVHFSPDQLMHNQRLMPLFQELDAKQKAQEKLDPYFQAVQQMANQMGLLQEIVNGRALRFVPPTPEQFQKSDHWAGFEAYTDEQKLRFALMAAGFTSQDPEVKSKLGDYIQRFQDMAKAQNPSLYPSSFKMDKETHFNELRPFRLAWALGVLSCVLLTFAFFSSWTGWYMGGMVTFALTLIIQTYGFVLRSLIAGRPPVTNMYESVIWVAFGALVFGLILEWVYRKRIIALGAMIFATFALIVADSSSAVIDDGLHPLEPVLRSNLWLTVHVLTITLAYSAFAIALILGNIGLGQLVFLRKESKQIPFKQLAFFAYRGVQVGVILLAAGTILGGVWADYSWGRFWGWDPKETWALIALLGYLALLHARFSGMVGPVGFLSGCIVAFMGVLMAWYGVNFVLGAGLHSYGFGAGGVSYVATYCCVQLLYVGFGIWVHRSLLAEKSAARAKTDSSLPKGQ
jgi:cytochrome c-type biogenesis protein CcsB